jgi:hypothetical protein
MKGQIESWAEWILVRVQIVVANLDVEVLQWPGGSFIAPCLWLYAVLRSFRSVDARSAVFTIRVALGVEVSTNSIVQTWGFETNDDCLRGRRHPC